MASARAIFSLKSENAVTCNLTWVGILVAQKQSGALGLRGKTEALEFTT